MTGFIEGENGRYFVTEAAKKTWETIEAAREMAQSLPKEEQNLEAEIVYFDTEYRQQGLAGRSFNARNSYFYK